MSEIFIVVGLKAKAGAEDKLRQDLSVLVEPSRAEDGNLRYDLFEDRDQPGLSCSLSSGRPSKPATSIMSTDRIFCTSMPTA